MDSEFYIDQLIEREKGAQPDPFLSTRVMARIAPPAPVYLSLVKGAFAAVALALVLLSGIHLGSALVPLQETWEALHTFKFDSAFSTWLYRIAVNSCLNHTARLRRRNLLVTAGDALRQLFMFEDPQRDPHGLLEDEQRDRAVREAIGLLPEKQRTAFVLSKYDDLTQKEIAAIMHTTEGAVEQLLQRAKSALRKKLNPIVGK